MAENPPKKGTQLIKDFFELQKSEIEVRKNELEFRGKDADNGGFFYGRSNQKENLQPE